jgi:hypothetical protein
LLRFNPSAACIHAASVTRIPANAKWLEFEGQPVFFQFAEHRWFSYEGKKSQANLSLLSTNFGSDFWQSRKKDFLQRAKWFGHERLD